MKIEAMAAGQIVPPFEILDATHKNHRRRPRHRLLPGRLQAFLGHARGHRRDPWITSAGCTRRAGSYVVDFYQKELKLNVIAFPILRRAAGARLVSAADQGLKDFKVMRPDRHRCRSSAWAQTVNMPGGEIMPSAQRGVIDCAEWVGGIEDLRLGLPQVWRRSLHPGHARRPDRRADDQHRRLEELYAQQQEAVRSGAETFLRWWVKWQRQLPTPSRRCAEKHGTQLLHTARRADRVLQSVGRHRQGRVGEEPHLQEGVVRSRRLDRGTGKAMFPPYSFAANYASRRRPPKEGKVEVAALRCTVRARSRPRACQGLVDPIKTSVYPAFAPVTLFEEEELRRGISCAFGGGASRATAFSAGVQAQTSLKQATWPASLTLYENFTYFVERVHKVSGGSLKIDAMPAGQVVPAFEVLDATHKKVLDGAHAWSGYWVGKNKAAILCTGGPGGNSAWT